MSEKMHERNNKKLPPRTTGLRRVIPVSERRLVTSGMGGRSMAEVLSCPLQESHVRTGVHYHNGRRGMMLDRGRRDYLPLRNL